MQIRVARQGANQPEFPGSNVSNCLSCNSRSGSRNDPGLGADTKKPAEAGEELINGIGKNMGIMYKVLVYCVSVSVFPIEHPLDGL